MGRYRTFSPTRVVHNPENLRTIVVLIDIASICEFFLIFIQVFSIVWICPKSSSCQFCFFLTAY